MALLLLIAGTTSLFAQNTASISGIVTDAESGEALTGANVILTRPGAAGIVGGSAADFNGQYTIANVPAGSYLLTVRFVGYNESQTAVDLAAGESASMDIQLSMGGLDLNTIVISASRQAEKVLDAPASISVLDAREVEQEVVPSTVSVLRNTTGVDIAQTGVDRNEVVLRGFNNAFSGSAYILTDYRQAAVPSLNVNIHSIMPTLGIDIERIEVVRGPGSALYGAGVDEGVIHFISKDPFSYPGTTIAISGGERSLLGGEFRHAGVVNNNLGYKLTAKFAQAQDWELDPNNPEDAMQLALDDDDLERSYDYQKFNINGMATYKFNDTVSLTANLGTSGLDAVVLSGIGTLQADGFSNSYGQLRLQANRFFAQVYASQNNANDSFVYGTGNKVVDNGTELNAQAQYDFDLANERARVIVGVDYQQTNPDTEGTILGRNEDNDEILEFGAYAQGTLAVTDQVDLTAALRFDESNIFDPRLSPRAAIVFKANNSNTFRASFNRAFSSPGPNSLFLDIVGQSTQLSATQQLLVMGRGSADGFTFDSFRATNSARFFLPVPGFFDNNFNVDAMPLVALYGAAAGGGLAEALLANQVGGLGLTDQQQTLLGQLIGYTAQNASLGLGAATSAGTTQLGIPDDSEDGFRPVSGPIDIAPLKQTTTQTIEVGYKGLLNNTVLFALDAYVTNKKNFTGPLLVETPFVYLQQAEFGVDVAGSVGALLATSTDATIQQLVGGLGLTGMTPNDVVATIAQLVAGSFPDNQAIAVVQSDQDVLPPGTENAVGGFAAYRNFGNINYWGVDASVQVLASEYLTLFANMSLVSDDFFDNEELDETNTDLQLALNAPTFKTKLGGSYRLAGGLSVNASARYTEGFPVRSGSDYIGEVDDYFLVDLGAGYDFRDTVDGLRIDFTIQNLLNNEHREFVGAPQLGRMGLARLTYSF